MRHQQCGERCGASPRLLMKPDARDAIENVLACRRELNLPMPEEAGCETIEVGA